MLKDKNYGNNPKKYRRANKNGLVNPVNPEYVTRLNQLVTNPVSVPTKQSEVIDIGGIESTNNDVVDINSDDTTIQILEYELLFLNKTLENIYSLKKSEKFLKQRVVVLVKCLNQLKSIQDSVNKQGLILDSSSGSELTSVPESTIIDIVEDKIISETLSSTKSNNNLAQLTISVAEDLISKPSANIQDFE